MDSLISVAIRKRDQSVMYVNDGQAGFISGQSCDEVDKVRCLNIPPINPPSEPLSLALGDMDGDGALDTVIGAGDLIRSVGDGLAVLFNDGTRKIRYALYFCSRPEF